MAGLARKRILDRASRCCCIAQAPVTYFHKACLLLSACSEGDMVHKCETSGIQKVVSTTARLVTVRINSSTGVTSCV